MNMTIRWLGRVLQSAAEGELVIESDGPDGTWVQSLLVKPLPLNRVIEYGDVKLEYWDETEEAAAAVAVVFGIDFVKVIKMNSDSYLNLTDTRKTRFSITNDPVCWRRPTSANIINHIVNKKWLAYQMIVDFCFHSYDDDDVANEGGPFNRVVVPLITCFVRIWQNRGLIIIIITE